MTRHPAAQTARDAAAHAIRAHRTGNILGAAILLAIAEDAAISAQQDAADDADEMAEIDEPTAEMEAASEDIANAAEQAAAAHDRAAEICGQI